MPLCLQVCKGHHFPIERAVVCVTLHVDNPIKVYTTRRHMFLFFKPKRLLALLLALKGSERFAAAVSYYNILLKVWMAIWDISVPFRFASR